MEPYRERFKHVPCDACDKELRKKTHPSQQSRPNFFLLREIPFGKRAACQVTINITNYFAFVHTDLSLIKRKRFQRISIVVKFSKDEFTITSDKRTRGVSIILE